MKTHHLLPRIFEKIDDDYRFLLRCLADAVQEVGEAELLPVLRRVMPDDPGSSDSVALRADATAPALANDDPRILRLLSVAFQLLNLVEENSAAQIRRQQETLEGADHEPGLWAQNLKQLAKAGFTPEAIAAAFPDLRVEPVLTAHPTEAKRPTVLLIHRQLYLLMVALENTMWTPAEREDIHNQIRAVLQRLWTTGEIYLAKPDVTQELDNVLYYLREVFPPVLGRLDQRLAQAWRAAGHDASLIDAPEKLPRVVFGSWVGGDRDGHPLVTPEVTRGALARMRREALGMLGEHLFHLGERLSLSARHVKAPASLVEAIAERAAALGEAGARATTRNPIEPWRQFVNLMRVRLEATERREPGAYARHTDLRDDLALLRRTLIEARAGRIASAEVLPVERLAQVFGFSLARLDIRQNSAFHDKAMGQLLAAAGFKDCEFENWDEIKRLELLEAELRSPRPFAPHRAALGPEAKAVLGCFQVVAEHIEATGGGTKVGEGIGSLIVSMTRNLSDLLVVYLLAREVGLARHEADGLTCPVAVVPLFETADDLARAPRILERFLTHPVTRRSIAWRARATGQPPHQQVMVGYSDSNKDAGILAAQWRLHRALDELSQVGHRQGVRVWFFHGRGGTTSRGAGPTHRFLEALPEGSLNGLFRLTEQGESIAQKYANQITATYNLELLAAGVAATTLKHRAVADGRHEPLAAALDRLSDHSQSVYRELLETDGFLTFWSATTPIDVLERSTIGSRPARRTGQRSMADLRAIPWVFSWNQARYYLPGWFGVGGGLERLEQHEPELYAQLADQGTRMAFLRYVLYNVETSMASADEEIMREYAALVPDAAVRERFLALILAEWQRTQTAIDKLFRAPRDVRRPRMTQTLVRRDRGLRVLHHQQIALLAEWRAAQAAGNEERAAALLPVLLLSVNAIASGLRTTG